jgi:hypothetical protein
VLLDHQRVRMKVIGDGVADTLGLDGIYDDPMWRHRVYLTALEQDLLRCWWVRRLAFIAHAGAASLTSTQSYSRLEHSLGLLSLVDSLDPGDELARAAALVHDVGHLPLSHTFEGVAGLDHHQIGRDRITQLSPVFAAHGIDVDHVLDVVEGLRPSALHGPTEALRLDHLESWLRSGHAHGRTREPPADTLAKLRLHNGAVDTDPTTAAYLVELAVGEARWRTSTPNVTATGLVRQLSAMLLTDVDSDGQHHIATMTDDEFWAMLLTHPLTSQTAHAYRRDPGAWAATTLDSTPTRNSDPSDPMSSGSIEFDVGRLYLDLPLVDGQPMTDHSHFATVADLPRLFLILHDTAPPSW